ncbi:superoxide dismutase [bacterium]|nr:MAG: superoxide dismutase [bacterium]
MKKLIKSTLLVLAMVTSTLTVAQAQFTQAPLPYAYDALESYIDAQTMEIHYSKHHAGYVAKLNAALEAYPDAPKSINQILANITKYNTAVRNNAGGHFNHTLFWNILAPASGQTPDAFLTEAIQADFGSFENFQAELNKAASTRFGSGWAWLIVSKEGKLIICSTPNQDNPLMEDAEVKGTPILGIDVWEHAYYLKYQNKRGDYLNAIWNVINWSEVSKRHKLAKRSSKFVFETWKQLDAFHTIMDATYHPTEEGNVEPIKKELKNFVKIAESLQKEKKPEVFNTLEINEATKVLVDATKKFQKGFKKLKPEQVVAEMDVLHNHFHKVLDLCRLY